MNEEVHLGELPVLPQTAFLHKLAPALWQRPDVLGIWLEGSLGRGAADHYSDVDLYVGVEPTLLEQWRSLNVQQLFSDHYAAHAFSTFSAEFFVYHVYLTTGGIYDLHIQPRNRDLPKSNRLILACRDEGYRMDLMAATLDSVADNAVLFAPQPLDPSLLPPLLVAFWINADKSRKVLYRNQDFIGYAGLYLFRQMLARLLFIEQTGVDCGDLTRPTIHGLKAAATVLRQALGDDLGRLMGAPATTRLELCQAQDRLYLEVARVGRVLATQFQITYPEALEQTVMENWRKFKTEELGL